MKPRAGFRMNLPQVRGLTDAETLALICGDDPQRPVFESEGAMRAAWEAHRDEIQCNPGTRPFAWWHFEHPEYGDPVGTDALVALVELGEVSEGERAHWRSLGGVYWPKEAEAAWQKRKAAK